MKPLILANIKGHLERAIIELYYAHAEVAFDNTDAKSVDVAITLASARNLVESVRTLLLGASEAASNSNHSLTDRPGSASLLVDTFVEIRPVL
jgi:hypothetical protein